jgi:hypothetical protein
MENFDDIFGEDSVQGLTVVSIVGGTITFGHEVSGRWDNDGNGIFEASVDTVVMVGEEHSVDVENLEGMSDQEQQATSDLIGEFFHPFEFDLIS